MKNNIKLNFIWYTVAKMALKIKLQKLCIFLKHHIPVRKIGTYLEFPPHDSTYIDRFLEQVLNPSHVS